MAPKAAKAKAAKPQMRSDLGGGPRVDFDGPSGPGGPMPQ